MVQRLLMVALLVAGLGVAGVGLTGCMVPTSSERSEDPSPPVESPATSSRLAPGLYDLEDGTSQALGTLAWSDLEGGFWFIADGTKAEGDAGATVAVISNGASFQSQLEPLKGKSVVAIGTRLEGASIRMAGPELEIESIEEVTDTPGAAE